MKEVGKLFYEDGRYEFRLEEMSLVVFGNHIEWVMQAASEIGQEIAQNDLEGRISELENLVEFGEAEPMDLEYAKFLKKERFETIPQCIVTMGNIDYHWAAPEGRKMRPDEFGSHPYRRIIDMSLTHNDSFLKNENGVNTAE